MVVDTFAITGTQKAYKYARSAIARSGATRSNYVLPWATVDLITRDGFGNVTRTDISKYIRHGSLQVTQALNDEADTASFQIVPDAPVSAVPKVGQEIAVTWTPGSPPLFQGYALVIQFDRREMNRSPWVSVQCQDAMWRFDARIVTYRFPAQSVTTSIAFLVTWFCNDPEFPSPIDFTTTFVQANLASLPAIDFVNQRPSTVMRRLMSAIGGAFYVDGRDLHAWAGGLSEPNQTNPQPLTNTNPTLKAFRVTHDATQLRKRVIVEGRRASTLIPYPDIPAGQYTTQLGLPLNDATIFPNPGTPAWYVARVGTQWMQIRDPMVATPAGANPYQARTSRVYVPNVTGSERLWLKTMPVAPPAKGWVRVGGQFTRYVSIQGSHTDPEFALFVPPTALYPYGVLTVTVPIDEPVEWVDGVMGFEPRGLSWNFDYSLTPGDADVRAHPADTPVVTLAETQRSLGIWPPIEGFVQDGRYSYAGALARANSDLDAFSEPQITADWDTDDLHAAPGRPQVINLTGSSVIDPLSTTLTITRVEISFPLRTEPPRRRCVGGRVKESTFLDLVLTDET